MEKYKEILHRHYDIKEAKLKKLEGYGSINYRVDVGNNQYVLKEYKNTKENTDLLQSENKILETLETLNELEFPKVIPTNTDELMVWDDSHIYRLLSFVKGDFLADVEHTESLLESLGSFLGIMNIKLQGIKDPVITAKVTEWDLQHFTLNRKLISHIENVQERTLVEYFFMQYEQQVSPVLYTLRKSIIHSDANNWNVLTKKGKVSGIIDFGDMCYSAIINDLAIALMYSLLDKEDPLRWTIPIIKGFHQNFPLLEDEIDILYYLVAARLCTSLCNSAFHKKDHPNSEYITITEKPAWKLLHQWIAINPLKAKDTFRKATGFSSCLKKNTNKSLKKEKNIRVKHFH